MYSYGGERGGGLAYLIIGGTNYVALTGATRAPIFCKPLPNADFGNIEIIAIIFIHVKIMLTVYNPFTWFQLCEETQ